MLAFIIILIVINILLNIVLKMNMNNSKDIALKNNSIGKTKEQFIEENIDNNIWTIKSDLSFKVDNKLKIIYINGLKHLKNLEIADAIDNLSTYDNLKIVKIEKVIKIIEYIVAGLFIYYCIGTDGEANDVLGLAIILFYIMLFLRIKIYKKGKEKKIKIINKYNFTIQEKKLYMRNSQSINTFSNRLSVSSSLLFFIIIWFYWL